MGTRKYYFKGLYEHKNQIIMRRQNTGVIQFEPKKTDRRKMLVTGSHVSIVLPATLERLNGGMKQSSNKGSVKTGLKTTVFTCFWSGNKNHFWPVTLVVVNED